MLIFLLVIPLSMFVFAGIRLLLLHKTNLQFRSELLDKLTSNDFNYLVYSHKAEISTEELPRRGDKPIRDDSKMLECDTSSTPTQRLLMIKHSKIPNIVTFLRLALLVPFVWLVRTDSSRHYIAAAVVLIVATVTDLLDGYLARKLNSISDFGDVLDVLADRMLAVVSVTFLMVTGTANFYMGLIVICRELAADSIRSLAARSGTSLPHNIFGQVKLVAIISAAVAGLLTLAGVNSLATGQRLANASLAIAVATGMLSIIIMLRSRKASS